MKVKCQKCRTYFNLKETKDCPNCGYHVDIISRFFIKLERYGKIGFLIIAGLVVVIIGLKKVIGF